MKRIAVLVGGIGFAAASLAATVLKPEMEPRFNGAEPNEWTMDFRAAQSNSLAAVSRTVVLFTGAWWCPWCQPLEKKVLNTDAWRAFAGERGLYEVMADFPNRDGTGYFCWLWEAGFQERNGLTAETAAAAVVERLHLQGAMSEPGGTARHATNMKVSVDWDDSVTNCWEGFAAEPTTDYRGIGYPTMVVLAPNGEELGRFSPDVRDYPERQIHWTDAAAFAQVSNAYSLATAGKSYVAVGVAPDCASKGTATELAGKVYKAKTKIALTAKPAKGHVFAGWFANGHPAQTTQDYRQAGNTFVTGDEDTVLEARFLKVEEDTLSFDVALALSGFEAGEEVDETLEIDSGSFPTVKVTGLPKGLTFDAKALTVRGTCVKPGFYSVTVKASNASGYAFNQTLEMEIGNLFDEDISGNDQELGVGEPFEGTVEDLFDVSSETRTLKSLSVSGLPKGLSVSTKDRKTISGTASAAGRWTVTGTATFADGVKETATLTFTVDDLESPAWEFVDFSELIDLCVGESVGDDGAFVGFATPSNGLLEVKGLPPGLSVRRTPSESEDGIVNVLVVGMPTSAGAYEVVATAKDADGTSAKVKRTITVADSPSVFVRVQAVGGGTVSGGGVARAGSSIQLTAKPDKGSVFAGWFLESGEPVANDGKTDYRASPRSVPVVDGMQTAWTALFVTKEEDVEAGVEIDGIEDGDEYDLSADEDFELCFGVSSCSLPSVGMSGLPAGVVYTRVADAEGNHFVTYSPETAKAEPYPGRYPVLLKVVNASKVTETRSFKIVVANWTNALVHVDDDFGAFKPGLPIDPIDLSAAVDFAAGDTLKVTDLPSGLVYNDKAKKGVGAHTITGTPKKPGDYTLLLTAKVGGKTVKVTVSLTVLPHPVVSVELDDESEEAGNAVTGTGTYKRGQKAKLTAKPAAGWVFAGWEGADGLSGFDALSPKLTLPVDSDDIELQAKFVPVWEDLLFVADFDFDGTNTCRLALGENLSVTRPGLIADLVETVSQPSFSVSGLPKGLKCNAKSALLSGTTSKSGVYYATVEAKNAGGYAFTRVLRFVVLKADGSEPSEAKEVNTAAIDLFVLDDIFTGDWFSDDDLFFWVDPSDGDADVSRVKIEGLPKGLEASVVYADGGAEVYCSGVPSQAGRFKISVDVTYADKTTARTEHNYIVFDGGSAWLDVEALSNGGKVTGTGVYRAGGKVKITAKPKSGQVFAGWWLESVIPDAGIQLGPFDGLSELAGADYRTASVSFPLVLDLMETAGVFGAFEAKADDAAVEILTDSDVWELDLEEDDSFPFEVLSDSLPKASAKGLPTGVKLDKSGLMLTYLAKNASKIVPGVYDVVISASNQSKAKGSKTIRLIVPNKECDVIGGLDPAMDAYVLRSGVTCPEDFVSPYVDDGWTLSVKGLPAGLQWDVKSGRITGIPTTAGAKTVTFTAKRKGEASQVSTITLTVKTDPALVGGFAGQVMAAESPVGTLTFDAAASGKISAKVVVGSKSFAFAANGWEGIEESADATNAVVNLKEAKSGATLAVSLDLNASWNGLQLAAAFRQAADGQSMDGLAQRNPFGKGGVPEANAAAKELAGTWKFSLMANEGNRFVLIQNQSGRADLTVKIKDSGSAALSGSVGGTTISGTVTLRANADGTYAVPFVQPGKKKACSLDLRFVDDVIEAGWTPDYVEYAPGLHAPGCFVDFTDNPSK